MNTNNSTISYNTDTLKKDFLFDEEWFLQDTEIRNILEKHNMPVGLITWYINAQEYIKSKAVSPDMNFLGMGHFHVLPFIYHLDHWVSTRSNVPKVIKHEITSCNYNSLPQLSDQLLTWYNEIIPHVREFKKKLPSDTLWLAGIKTETQGKSTDEIINLYAPKQWAVSTLLQHIASLKQLAWIMKYTSEATSMYIYHTNQIIAELNTTFKTDIMELITQQNNILQANR
jgi:hypothetical protein